MGIYRDNLLIIVIVQNTLDLSFTDIAFVMYFIILDKFVSWRYGKNTLCP